MKIIMSSGPAVGDAHGCPFRHSDVDQLAHKLRAYGVPSTGIQEVGMGMENTSLWH